MKQVVLVFTILAMAHGARAQERDAGVPSFVLSPGAMVAWGTQGFGFDAELSGTRYGSSFGLGVAVGGNPDRFYFELQPVALFDLRGANSTDVSTLFVGLNPGLVVDWSGPQRTGGQVTLWTEYFYACCHGGFFVLPLVPFARLQLFAHEYVVSAGLMLKFGVPLPWTRD
jgi:hypothetical protein